MLTGGSFNICCDMPFESSHPIAPDIRGPMGTSLVRDQALGEGTHGQLAEKYGRSLDAIKQFASRNAGEINEAKQEMSREDIEPWVLRSVIAWPCIGSRLSRWMTGCSRGVFDSRPGSPVPVFVTESVAPDRRRAGSVTGEGPPRSGHHPQIR